MSTICGGCLKAPCVCGAPYKRELEKLAEDEVRFEQAVLDAPQKTVQRAMYQADLDRVRNKIFQIRMILQNM